MRTRLAGVLALSWVWVVPSSAAQSLSSPDVGRTAPIYAAEALAKRLDAYFAPLAATADFSGIIRVERDRRVLIERRYGYADWEAKRPHDDGTVFAAASITKSVLAALLLDLNEEGILALDDAVARHLPVLEGRLGASLDDVLRHRAGLPRDLPEDLGTDAAADGIARWLATRPDLLSASGKKAYSNVGYALLAEVIEAATGEPFGLLAERRLLMPAGMTQSLVTDVAVERLPGGAQPYTAGPSPLGVQAPVAAVVDVGASGLVVTVRDLAHWGTALGERRDTALFEGDDPLGSLERGVDEGLLYLSAQGSLPGYAAGVTVWPDAELTVAYATNLFNHPVIGIEDILRGIVHGEAPEPLAPRPPDVALEEAHLSLAGRYEHPAFGPVLIEADPSGHGMRLTMPQREAYWSFYLTPIEGGRLHWRAFDTIFEAGLGSAIDAVAWSLRDPERFSMYRTGSDRGGER